MSDRAVFPNRSHPGLRAARVRRGFSQEELAFLSGVPQPRLSRAERGYVWLSDAEKVRLAEVLRIDVDGLDSPSPEAGTTSAKQAGGT